VHQSFYRKKTDKMANKSPLPDFVDDAEIEHPGIALQYSALQSVTRCLFARDESDDFRYAVLLQSGIVWQHYNAIVLLLSHRFGMQGLVVCRALFEIVAGTLYLLQNPSLLADFTDHGKLLFYERGLGVGLRARELAKISPECEAITLRLKARPRKPWHGGTIKGISETVGLGDTYNLLYKDASSATHADATMILSQGSRGWNRSLRRYRSVKEAHLVRCTPFWPTGYVMQQAAEALDLGCDEQISALSLLMNRRAKDAAMPN
jgi:hypothetical protein